MQTVKRETRCIRGLCCRFRMPYMPSFNATVPACALSYISKACRLILQDLRPTTLSTYLRRRMRTFAYLGREQLICQGIRRAWSGFTTVWLILALLKVEYLDAAKAAGRICRKICVACWCPDVERNGIPIAALNDIMQANYCWRDKYLSCLGVPSGCWPESWDFLAAVTAVSIDT